MQSKEFDYQEVTRIIEKLINNQKIACMEVTEANPLPDDRSNK